MLSSGFKFLRGTYNDLDLDLWKTVTSVTDTGREGLGENFGNW